MSLFLNLVQVGLLGLVIWMMSDIAKAVTHLIEAFGEFTTSLDHTAEEIRKEAEKNGE